MGIIIGLKPASELTPLIQEVGCPAQLGRKVKAHLGSMLDAHLVGMLSKLI